MAVTMTVRVADIDPAAVRGWHVRWGRTISQQVVDALQDRFAAVPTPPGLHLRVAGEDLTSATPLEENQQVLAKLLGLENVSSQQVVTASAFSFSPQAAAGEELGEGPEQEGEGAPRLGVWGSGALSSFRGQEDGLTSLDGEVTTALVGADWSTERWQAGAALSQSWANGSYAAAGDNRVDGKISSTMTGLFPYGRYGLTPRLGVWAVAGYGWGTLSVKPADDEREYKPAANLRMVAVGIADRWLDGGAAGLSLATTTDLLLVGATSEAVDDLAASENSVSRLRVGLEATWPVPLANDASLLPSLELGMRQDGGDAETGFGLDIGAGIVWHHPARGIRGEVRGRTLLTHREKEFREQGLSLSFAWDSSPSHRGPSLSLNHAVGASASGGMDSLLSPAVMEGLDGPGSNGQRFAAEMAYGFPMANDRLTLSPGLALAFSPDSRSYGLLWSLAPYSSHQGQGQGEPWEIALEGERQESVSFASPAEHSLKLRFSLLL
ncbi:MAG: autotransporter outer membrane beta-barrel domain-containing protein [Synechococcus sp. SB0670_bin_20]|nr:autotransporter outer membrane beta-barrel domain-containing protein [Synechococcus sp. SB0670_bin_20]